MSEGFSPVTVIDVVVERPQVCRRPSLIRKALPVLVVSFISVSFLHVQPASPTGQPPPPRAIYTPKPVYRPEWTKQGLTGKGVVLVTIDKQTGMVTGARILTTTGNQQLDGAALQAYSQWRFDPRTVAVSQLKIPIEFANRPPPKSAKRTLPQPVILLILLAVAGAAIAIVKRRKVLR
jgi:TonB family protein